VRASSPGTLRTPGNERENITSPVESLALAAFAQLHHLLPRPPINAETPRRRDAEGEEMLSSPAFPAFSARNPLGRAEATKRNGSLAEKGEG